ncbi:helix-turn-helix domain containing protein [Aliarcobacter cryaerophilus]|uniref:Helix-turn-helix domain containing protein n=1 Tax=Aliarcobacter cryaerophilus TaxID=28198 RepID=A0AA46NU17_9BACT|nr:helix-turn-helix domain containing protein [Aliarcobacter cryaerophilus]UYF42553.1 helix-turn-helix domain containing protein [Aliarcobacter cryaerophilus]
MNVKITTEKMKIAMNATSYLELAKQLNITLPTIDSWKKRNTIPNKYLLKVSEDTGVSIDWLLSEDKPTFDISQVNKGNDLSKYFIALQSVVSATNKEDELIEDIKNLMKKYLGE